MNPGQAHGTHSPQPNEATDSVGSLTATLIWYQDAFDVLMLLLAFRSADTQGKSAVLAVAGAVGNRGAA